MKIEALLSYLDDHYSASIGAVKLMDHLLELELDESTLTFLHGLRSEVVQEQEVLHGVIRHLGASPSIMGQTASWLAEELGWTRLHRVPGASPDIALFKALEALLLGVTGKQALWRLLKSLSYDDAYHSALVSVNAGALEDQSADQLSRIEAHRLRMGKKCFCTAHPVGRVHG